MPGALVRESLVPRPALTAQDWQLRHAGTGCGSRRLVDSPSYSLRSSFTICGRRALVRRYSKHGCALGVIANQGQLL
jgi:hypothetical protein